MLAARLEAEQTEALAKEAWAAVGPIDPAADAAEAFRSNSKAAGVLGRVPAGVRSRLEEKVLAGLQEQQAAGAAEEAARALHRDHAVEVVRQAIVRRDGGTVQRALAALGEEDRARVWPRAAAGLDLKPGDLEYPPPPAEGTAAPPAFDLEAYLDADPAAALVEGGEAEAVLARLPAGMRSRSEGRLAEKLAAGRVSRWVDKLRDAAGPSAGSGAGAGEAGGSVLEVPEVQSLLGLLPPGLREEVGAQAARLIDGEAVEKLAAAARRLIEQERALDLLRTALGLNDGDGADAVMSAVGAALDVTNQADLDRLVSQAVPGGTAALARLARMGASVPAVDLTEHLAGEADLLTAARRAGGVEDLLRRAGGLRPQVEAELARVLEADRVGRAVRKAAEMVSPGERAASDVLAAVRDLPGVRELLGRLPKGSRQEAYRMLGEQLDASGIEAAVGEVSRALHLDRAEAALRRAAAAGDPDAADRALAGLTGDQARAVSEAAFGG
jgi:tetratricopeptide (TPR) repeat protein